VWLLIGLASSAVHLAVIKRSLRAIWRHDAAKAQRMAMLGAPLRVLLLSPVMLLVVRNGLVACLAWVAGFSLGHLMVSWYVLSRAQCPMTSEKVA